MEIINQVFIHQWFFVFVGEYHNCIIRYSVKIPPQQFKPYYLVTRSVVARYDAINYYAPVKTDLAPKTERPKPRT